MQLIINKDSNTFVNSVLFNSPVSNIAFKRGDAAKVELIFASENTALSATNDKTIILGLKESGKYDGTFVVSTSSYTTDNTRYVMNPNFNTVALNDLLNSGDGNDGNDVGSVDLMLEITWSEDGGSTWYSSNTITATINNDVIKGLEGTPLQEADPIDWLRTYGVLAPLSLSSAPVDETISINLSNPYAVITGNVLYAGLYNNRVSFTSTGAPMPPPLPLSGLPPLAIFWNSSLSRWYVSDYIQFASFYSTSNTVDPMSATNWTIVDVAVGGLSTIKTSGHLGQDAIVDSLSCYKCTRTYPVKWVKIS